MTTRSRSSLGYTGLFFVSVAQEFASFKIPLSLSIVTACLYHPFNRTFSVDYTHASESLVHYVAEQCGLDIDPGLKGYRGEMRSVEARQTYLSDKTHRIRFVYTPKHCRRLNQIEIWFSVLRRKLTQFGSFGSLNDLEERILRFIDYYNVTVAKPYRWT